MQGMSPRRAEARRARRRGRRAERQSLCGARLPSGAGRRSCGGPHPHAAAGGDGGRACRRRPRRPDGAAASGRVVRRRGAVGRPPRAARIRAACARSAGVRDSIDPYQFGPVLTDFDLHLFSEGRHYRAWEQLGSRRRTIGPVAGGALCRLGAERPARQRDRRVQPVGRPRARDAAAGALGRCGRFHSRPAGRRSLQVRDAHRAGHLLHKADPFARELETPPQTASVVSTGGSYEWGDGEWMRDRESLGEWRERPMSIYEVHLGSWRRRRGRAAVQPDVPRAGRHARARTCATWATRTSSCCP